MRYRTHRKQRSDALSEGSGSELALVQQLGGARGEHGTAIDPLMVRRDVG